jgi:hypothetical protein
MLSPFWKTSLAILGVSLLVGFAVRFVVNDKPTDPIATKAAVAPAAEMEQKLQHVKFPAVGVITNPLNFVIITPIKTLDDDTPMFYIKYVAGGGDRISQKDLAKDLARLSGRDEPEKVAEMFYWYYHDRWQ